MKLTEPVRQAAARQPDAPAVAGPDGELTYAELDRTADRIAAALAARGVRAGARVVLWAEKSVLVVAAMQAALRLGAVYVPIDPLSPADRAARIVRGCAASVVITTKARSDELRDAAPAYLLLPTPGAAWSEIESPPAGPPPEPDTTEDSLAYILYTSGSTGEPKGVCISHRNALAFVDWAVAELGLGPEDRLSNHAPFHFDLSVLDLYGAFRAGASVSLIPETFSYSPAQLVDFVARERISVWYSVPSVLMLMMDEAALLDADLPALRAVLFAGEPFPVHYVRRLRRWWPDVRLFNLYGPTETNVCTAYEVTDVAPDRITPVPIGTAASGDRVWAVRADGTSAGPGEEGELLVSGPTVMLGYWGGRPQGELPYRTGDLVVLDDDGNYQYVGRRDDCVKVRGHRIEPGEIEAALLRHPAVAAAAVVTAGDGLHRELVAFLVAVDGDRPGLLEIKRHSAGLLPRSMLVDRVRWLDRLPRSGTGKVDRRRLRQIVADEPFRNSAERRPSG
ncbi:amino acid adenylation domain-containing protein [Micromonospora arborensis]|uniref:amino acid adenylation domain-containing protein n=1 Tax=Micromonospora arborensis TaxID=2116518 RepID=UPI003416BD50